MTLKELRESHALTQTEVAAHCRVTVTTVSAWERGTAKPRLVHIRDLAKLFNVSIDEINKAIEETERRTQTG